MRPFRHRPSFPNTLIPPVTSPGEPANPAGCRPAPRGPCPEKAAVEPHPSAPPGPHHPVHPDRITRSGPTHGKAAVMRQPKPPDAIEELRDFLSFAVPLRSANLAYKIRSWRYSRTQAITWLTSEAERAGISLGGHGDSLQFSDPSPEPAAPGTRQFEPPTISSAGSPPQPYCTTRGPRRSHRVRRLLRHRRRGQSRGP